MAVDAGQSAAAVATAAPTQYVVPRVQGDPAAARALAAAYRALANDVSAAARIAAQVTAELSHTWNGRGRHAAAHPAEVLQRNATATARALHEAADALDAYAHKLEAAHHHHFFSLHKLMAVAAVVTITAVAVVVTMGAAAAAEAALAATAAGEATAAAGAATAASAGAASGLLESTAGLVGLRALLSFVVPHLVQAELSAGFAATMDESVDGQLDWHEIGTAGAAGFAGSAGAGAATRVAAGVKFAKETWPLLHMLMPHLGQAAAWAGVDAGQQVADGGHVSMRELLLTAGMAGAGSALGARPIAVAKAYLARQSVNEMLTDGVILDAHEGPSLGHTLTKHVNVTDADLRRRILVEHRRWASRYFDKSTATRSINQALREHESAISEFLASDRAELRIRTTMSEPIGVVMDRSLNLRNATQVVVCLLRDDDGIFVMTSYPELPTR